MLRGHSYTFVDTIHSSILIYWDTLFVETLIHLTTFGHRSFENVCDYRTLPEAKHLIDFVDRNGHFDPDIVL